MFEAGNAFDAIEAVHDESVDLVVLDWVLARHLRATGRRSPVKLLQRMEAGVSSEAESAVEIALEPTRKAELDAVLRLLSDSNLPVTDLEIHIDAFTLARWIGIVVGTAGLEIYGRVALLRSLCVAERHRSKRIGAALVSAVVSRALAQGVRELYLLTTGATPYFANLGFVQIEREQAPIEIRNTAQFAALCPASAVCMCKTIGPLLEMAAIRRSARGAG